MKKPDVIVIGAGAAGLMCAIEAGRRGRRVLVIDHANKAGKKILMSGGGRCNFTNYHIESHHFLSNNPHFCKSALSRYTQYDFLALIRRFHVPFHEKSHGQLFCDRKSSDIVDMLLRCCEDVNVAISLNSRIKSVMRESDGFHIRLDNGENLKSRSVVVATGGLSIPTMGASPFGYQLAAQFGLNVLPTRAGLVPFTLQPHDKERYSVLSGISLPCQVSCNGQNFELDMLFTHRGLSGPAMLQISSYWQPGDDLAINWMTDRDWENDVLEQKRARPGTRLRHYLEQMLPKRVVPALFDDNILERELHGFPDQRLQEMVSSLKEWRMKPNGTEGYRTAEVTLGGVDTHALSSQTMEVKAIPGLYFIGEVLDVTGWLGGYNFQWAWSSGWAAGQVA
ncbi:BaiN/RdsA family NAD(P)/FAD-dependent oxidoreductase [Legionella spiritensis]|uniref:Flavoprotein n=1 Tax=Legionella spiritensis TaxID=452 RepID=A0A0W0ZAU0_LEGSP|nr:NAD(P)/FAD-dependent oxidoreductase [Legionella spiritensis]KTD66257.1 flavoprotein [Legionella spiritensis]SNV48366.1 flavoprotein [Legionella spiritensis]